MGLEPSVLDDDDDDDDDDDVWSGHSYAGLGLLNHWISCYVMLLK